MFTSYWMSQMSTLPLPPRSIFALSPAQVSPTWGSNSMAFKSLRESTWLYHYSSWSIHRMYMRVYTSPLTSLHYASPNRSNLFVETDLNSSLPITTPRRCPLYAMKMHQCVCLCCVRSGSMACRFTLVGYFTVQSVWIFRGNPVPWEWRNHLQQSPSRRDCS